MTTTLERARATADALNLPTNHATDVALAALELLGGIDLTDAHPDELDRVVGLARRGAAADSIVQAVINAAGRPELLEEACALVQAITDDPAVLDIDAAPSFAPAPRPEPPPAPSPLTLATLQADELRAQLAAAHATIAEQDAELLRRRHFDRISAARAGDGTLDTSDQVDIVDEIVAKLGDRIEAAVARTAADAFVVLFRDLIQTPVEAPGGPAAGAKAKGATKKAAGPQTSS